MLKTRGEEYVKFMKKTNMFIPFVSCNFSHNDDGLV